MPTTIGQHTVATFTSPVNGTTPIDANTVRGNDNTIRASYNNHDTDPGIHLQSSTLSARPAAGTAGRKWVTADAGSYKLWYDDGSRWHEVGNDHIEVEAIADENLVKGDVVEISGYNVGLNLPRVRKTTSAGPAFAIANETISNGSRGYVINTGIITGINTTTYGTSTEPAILYTATGGTLTATKPASGTYQASAYLLRHQQNNGVLFVEFSAPAIVERSDNTASTVVLRDGSGNFSAGTVTASLIGNVTGNITGNADTATKLSSNRTFALTGDVTGTASSDLTAGFSIASTIANDVITNAMISSTAAIAYSKLALTNSIVNADIAAAAAIADTKLATIATAGKVSNSATTATSTNVSDTIVARDSSGNFSAGTITANLTGNISGTAPAGTLTGTTLAANVVSSSLTSVGTLANLTVTNPITGSVTGSSGSTTGNAATATALQTPRNINGVSFNGTADITVTAAAGTLSGNTLASGVTASSLTSVGTLSSLAVSGTATLNTLASSGATITGGSINGTPIGGTTASTGAFSTLSSTSTTTLNGTTIPASKTLVDTNSSQGVSNKSISASSVTSAASANVGFSSLAKIATRAATPTMYFNTDVFVGTDFAAGAISDSIILYNGTYPGGTSPPTNSPAILFWSFTGTGFRRARLYERDGEIFARDNSNNETLISPHNFSLIPGGASEDVSFAYYSTNSEGRRVNVDMLRLARLVENLTGETLVYTDTTDIQLVPENMNNAN